MPKDFIGKNILNLKLNSMKRKNSEEIEIVVEEIRQHIVEASNYIDLHEYSDIWQEKAEEHLLSAVKKLRLLL